MTYPISTSTRKVAVLFVVAGLLALPAMAADHSQKDIVETAAGDGSFNTLVAAIKAAGLVEALQAEGPFTVFAPTDEAFAKLPAGTVDSLLEPGNVDQLKAILTYHVVAGKVPSSAVKNGASATTLQGDSLTFSVENGIVRLGDATVTAADVETSNGVIHVIDTVLLPR